MPSTYKPSPLSFGSPRTSPFRRPESPSHSSPASTIRPSTPTSTIVRPTTPSTSPTKPHTPLQSPSKLHTVTTPTIDDDNDEDEANSTTRNLTPSLTKRESYFATSTSPTRNSTPLANKPAMMNRMALGGDALAKLPSTQVREMREGFQVLDRDNDGVVDREDVVDMLTNLGQDASPQAIARFFPAGKPQTLTMPVFLNTLSTLLAPFSSQKELMNAFAAFDEDDSGQIDVNELRDALLRTSPEAGNRAITESEIDQVVGEFTGRREFGKGRGQGGRGEVFRYPEFVGSIMGAGEGGQKAEEVK
ncbi:MAG: hypothetical protein L6R39_000467 [Caloplaca ligustica]|nr:MAG: hypothetical protein L6R39_000467 [Caloplaca ligustica]